jgi:sugar-specific transcriptional regulator TrmB
MFEEDYENTFSRMGLKKDEAKVYLCCLNSKYGLHVQEITDKTEVKRSTVNLILDRLSERGFITFHTEGARKIFTAESPEHILYNMQELITDFRSLIPLLSFAKIGGKQSKVRFFEGVDGLNQIFKDMLLAMKINRDPKKEILSVTSGKDILDVLPRHVEDFIEKRVKERIPIRWIAPKTEINESFLNNAESSYRQMRFFDNKKYPFHIEIDIYANKIAMMSAEDKPSGIIIENEVLAKSFVSLFNLIWDSLV